MGHVAIDVKSPLVVMPLEGGGQLCENMGAGCDTPKPSGQLTWLSYFDVTGASTLQGGVLKLTEPPSQRWHWGFEQSHPYDPSAPVVIPTELCYSIWVSDTVGGEGRTRMVDMKVSNPAHPSGYAKSSTVRCWPVNESAVVRVA